MSQPPPDAVAYNAAPPAPLHPPYAPAAAVKRSASEMQSDPPLADSDNLSHAPKRPNLMNGTASSPTAPVGAAPAGANAAGANAAGVAFAAVRQPLPTGRDSRSSREPSVSVVQPIVEAQVRGKDSEDLVELIMELQSAYMRNLETISAQYERVSKELSDVKACLSTFLGAQLSAVEAANKHLDVHPPQGPPRRGRGPAIHWPPAPSPVPLSSPQTSFGTPLAGTFTPSHPTAASMPPSSAPPVVGGGSGPGSLDGPADHQGSPQPSAPEFRAPYVRFNAPPRTTLVLDVPPDGGVPSARTYSTLHTVRDVWDEYRFGLDGSPSIESLEKEWGSRWRPDPKGRTWFSRRKIVWDKVRELIHDGLSEDDAVREVENMRAGRSMHFLTNLLVANRKEVKASWRAAAAAATAAKLSK